MTKRPDYYDMMKRATDGWTWDRLEERYGKFETQSTFKKPYHSDEYPEMEFFYPDTPGMPYTPPGFPYPSWPYDDGEGYPYYSSTLCDHCSVSGWSHGHLNSECTDDYYAIGSALVFCGLGGTIQTAPLEAKWKVKSRTDSPIKKIVHYTGIMARGPTIGAGGLSIRVYPDWDNIKAIDGRKHAEFEITMIDGVGNECHTRSILLGCKEECCPADTALSYDATNAETIARESSETLTITGGCGPYTWSVAGTGFSLAYSNTDNRQNDLTADETACGTATITIIDDCGTSITGYVRCTTGGWTEKSTGVCEMSGVGTLIDTNPNKYELISDYKKQLQTRTRTAGCTRSGQTCSQAIAEGICPAYCEGQGGGANCDNCIDPTDVYCYVCEYTGGDAVFDCYSVTGLAYYEWDCV